MSEQMWTFGGGQVNMTVSAATPGTPADPRIQPILAKFLSLLEKSYFVRSDDKFQVFFDGFFEEVDAFFDNLRLDGQGLIDPNAEAEFTNEEIHELEEFMNSFSKKEKK